ncbi:MAG: hypothetical protein ABSA11_13825 [Candidatus Bathyarchaeia archaeon]
MTYEIRGFETHDLFSDFDLRKFDMEGHEIKMIPYLDEIKGKIVLETHSTYITDEFLKHDFKLYSNYERNKDIHGGVMQVYKDG